MSKLFIMPTDTGFEISKNPRKTDPPAEYPEGIIPRDELLDFINYLREKENVAIESRVEIKRTMFNTYRYSVGALAENELKRIKSSSSAEQVYEKCSAELAKKNSNWKVIPQFGYICEEDLFEYLVTVPGLSQQEAKELTLCIENRVFKRSAWEKDERLSTNFKTWARASGGFLRTRDYLPNLFRLEWLEFCHRNTASDATTFTVTEQSTRGAYNGYAYLTSRLMGASGDGLILGYRDNTNQLDKEKLILLAELLLKETGMPEMWVRNMNEDKLTVIKQKKTGVQ